MHCPATHATSRKEVESQRETEIWSRIIINPPRITASDAFKISVPKDRRSTKVRDHCYFKIQSACTCSFFYPPIFGRRRGLLVSINSPLETNNAAQSLSEVGSQF